MYQQPLENIVEMESVATSLRPNVRVRRALFLFVCLRFSPTLQIYIIMSHGIACVGVIFV
eukprot:m.71953 g.71953  ORF g.71953 m.71953 type:complete len:60 (-) comp12320_c0_seq2:4598-4777(-)